MSELCWGEHGAHPFGRLCHLLDSARCNWAHQPILSELSPAGPNTAVFRNILTFRDRRWSCGATGAAPHGGWVQGSRLCWCWNSNSNARPQLAEYRITCQTSLNVCVLIVQPLEKRTKVIQDTQNKYGLYFLHVFIFYMFNLSILFERWWVFDKKQRRWIMIYKQMVMNSGSKLITHLQCHK